MSLSYSRNSIHIAALDVRSIQLAPFLALRFVIRYPSVVLRDIGTERGRVAQGGCCARHAV